MWNWTPSIECQVRQEEQLNTIISHLSHDLRQKLEVSLETGPLNWFKKKKIKTKGFSLLKARIHWYYSPSPRLSIHDEISDIKAHMMHEYFHRVTILLIILSLKSESLTYQTACSSNEARVELTARLFRTRAQRTFFDIRVFEPIIGVNIRGRS